MTTSQNLLEEALFSPSFWHSRAAARVLEQLCQPEDVIPDQLAQALRHADERIRRRAVRLLAVLPLSAVVLSLFRQALKDDAWTVRRAALQGLALCGAGASTALADLLAALNDEASGVREAAIEAMAVFVSSAGIKGVEVETALLERLTDSDEAVREAAARALGSLGYPVRAVPSLVAALSDESAAVRALAVESLTSLGVATQKVEPALLERLDDPAPSVRRQVVSALGQLGTEQAVPALMRLLEGGWRDEAAWALGQLGRRLPHLEGLLLAAFRSGNSSLRAGAIQALACLDSTAALAECRRLCRGTDLRERRRAVRALGWFGARAAEIVPELEAALCDAQGKVRKAAVESLAALGGRAAPAVAGLLRRLDDCDARVRSACAAAVVRILPEVPALEQSWLTVLADPRHGAGYNLRQALARLDLPESVLTAFTATCIRRTAWHAAHSGEPSPLTGKACSPWQAARAAARQAGRKASRNCPADEQSSAARAARRAEHAWQLACLWSLLFPTR
jgi:HEAT repeat protein